MEVFKVINTRRSVRKFKPDQLDIKILTKILEAGNLAPSASNRQEWSFYVLDRSITNQIEDLLVNAVIKRGEEVSEEVQREAIADLPIPTENNDKLEGLLIFFRRLGGAPAVIVVDTKYEEDSWLSFCNRLDAAAAVENILLAAWAEGLGTCWMALPIKFSSAELKKLLDAPEDRELIAIIPIGYPDHEPAMPPKKDLHSKVKWFGY